MEKDFYSKKCFLDEDFCNSSCRNFIIKILDKFKDYYIDIFK